MTDKITVDFHHKANAGILAHLKKTNWVVAISDCSPQDHPDPYLQLGTHPELVARLWDELSLLLPEPCQWIINERPVLVHPRTGIIFGYAEGTHAYALRLPLAIQQDALQQGAKRTYRYPDHLFHLDTFGEEWIFCNWYKDEELWCLAAYEFAGETKT